MAASMRCRISKLTSLVDECVTLTVTGCQPKQELTLHLLAPLPAPSSKGHFSSVGHFVADTSGQVSLDIAPSSGGSYSGIDPMGLFWSMSPGQRQRKGLRFIQRVADRPMQLELRAMDGHRSLQEADELLQQRPLLRFQRSYLSDTVLRQPLRRDHGRLRGTLFSPRWPGQHPCVLDLFGMGGGIMEHRAALLASKGFRVLSLAIFNFDDRPVKLNELDMAYFEEAADFLLDQSPDNRLCVVGTSAGANAALELAMLRYEVAGVVWINGIHCRIIFPTRTGRTLWPCVLPDYSLQEQGVDNSCIFLRCFDAHCQEQHLVQAERTDAQLLLVNSAADMAIPSYSGSRIADRLRQAGKASNCELMLLPGAGHLLEPPYSPLNRVVYSDGVLWDYGGQSALQHHLAQVVAWQRVVQFLRSNLAPSSD